jgi:hypothetical protein
MVTYFVNVAMLDQSRCPDREWQCVGEVDYCGQEKAVGVLSNIDECTLYHVVL